jgi:DNA-binding transcriptional ArsR family regulator
MHDNLRVEIAQLHARICGGLADPNRILILYTLNDGNYSVNDLAVAVGLPQPTVSRHLKVLREAGMVIAKREGQSVYYMIADQRIIQALELLRAVLADILKNQANLVYHAGPALM